LKNPENLEQESVQQKIQDILKYLKPNDTLVWKNIGGIYQFKGNKQLNENET